MPYDVIEIEQNMLLNELTQVFDAATAQVLNRILSRMWVRVEETRKIHEEFDKLRKSVAELTAAQRRTEEAIRRLTQAQQRTEEAIRRLTQAQQRSEARLDRLEETVQKLIEAQQRSEARLDRLEETVQKLVEAQLRTESEVRRLAEGQQRMGQDLATVKGRQLELTYQQRAGAYFGPLLRRVRALLPFKLEDDLEAHLSPEEFRDLLRLDLLVRGQPRYHEGAPEVWLAVEVSAVIDRHDVERARRRAGYLRRAGYRAIPTVTGERATEGAEQEIEAHKVLMLLDGRTIAWEAALEEALA